jgi:GDP-L-fucose synthase
MCEAYRDQYGCNYISVMPTNLYGYNDNYNPEYSHVLPALIRRFHEAKENGNEEVVIWGTGTPKREFLFVDDLASAAFMVMQNYNEKQFLNMGSGEDLTIAELAELIGEIIGFRGKITYNTQKPDGTPRKLMDVSKIKQLGWSPQIALREGILLAYKDFLNQINLKKA